MNKDYIKKPLYIEEFRLSEYIRGICKYAGSKKRLLFYILYMIEQCQTQTFLDLCGGSGIVSMNVRAPRKIINDISVVHSVIYKLLSDENKSYALRDKIYYEGFTEEDYISAYSYWYTRKENSLNNFYDDELVTAAYYGLILLWAARLGNDLNFRISPELLKEKPCDQIVQSLNNEWYTRKESILSWNVGLDGAGVYNNSLFDILEYLAAHPENIKEHTTIYCDPPYLSGQSNKHKTSDSTYSCGSFGEDKHREMLTLLDRLPRDKCRVIISGYDSELYDDVLSSDGFGAWTKSFVKELTVNCGDGNHFKNNHRSTAQEFFYMNWHI